MLGLVGLLGLGCASAHERKIRRIYAAARADDLATFSQDLALGEERTKSLFETLRNVSREKNTVKVSEPGLARLPESSGTMFCAHAAFYDDSFWDFRIIKLPDTTHYYFIFRNDAGLHPQIVDVVWGGQSGLGVALAGLSAHSSRSTSRAPSAGEDCRTLNQTPQIPRNTELP